MLAVNVVHYAISILHWIVNLVITLGIVLMGMGEKLIIVWSLTINVCMVCHVHPYNDILSCDETVFLVMLLWYGKHS